MKSSIGSRAGKVAVYAFLTLLAALCFSPFYIMIINATHSSAELMTGLYLLPGRNTVANYLSMIKMIDIWQGFVNSIIVTGCATLLSAYFGAMAAFGMAKYRFKGHGVLFGVIMVSMMVPSQLGIIGFFRLCSGIGLLDSLILPAIANASTVFFVMQFMGTALPDSVLEAARIEGCGEIRVFHMVALPMARTALATMSIFNFVGSWNNFMTPMIVLFNQDRFTLPLLIMNLRGSFSRDFGATYCGIALSILPILIVFALMSRQITDGISAGAIKG